MLFYTQLFASKRESLAKIWLAAHWEKKLTKAHVFQCNLETTIKDIIYSKMTIGLRTSGHLLIGVVRIYSRKAKYLLADCSDALIKIKVAFRPVISRGAVSKCSTCWCYFHCLFLNTPDQTDLPVHGVEDTLKAITLIEDFTAFDVQLPDPSNIDVVDHFSLNQSRSEEITLKEDFGSGFLNLTDFGFIDTNRVGDEPQSQQTGQLDIAFLSLTQHGDTFGDEDRGLDLLDFLTNSSDHTESTNFITEEKPQISALNYQKDVDRRKEKTPTLNETTLFSNADQAFALEPVVNITPNFEKKRGKRKRKLVVDQAKELTNEFMREQLSDFSDLVAPLDLAPPTRQLMQWKESGSVDKLFAQPCSTVINPQINEFFSKSLQIKHFGVCAEDEVMRQDRQEVQRDISGFTTDLSVIDPEYTHNTEPSVFDHLNESQSESSLTQDENDSEFTHPELPSEAVLSCLTQSTSHHSQSVLSIQDFEEKRITRRARCLLNALKCNSDTKFSLQALCEGSTRWQAATTFYCLLVLNKLKAIHLHQSAPYEDIFATPGPNFCDE